MLLIVSLAVPCLLNAMAKDKNIISAELLYSPHALQRMAERGIQREEVDYVVRNGIRTWDLEDRGAHRYIERKNKSNPLIVVLNRNVEPNVVVTVFREIVAPKRPVRKFLAGRLRDEAYLKEQEAQKEKDLRHQK